MDAVESARALIRSGRILSQVANGTRSYRDPHRVDECVAVLKAIAVLAAIEERKLRRLTRRA